MKDDDGEFISRPDSWGSCALLVIYGWFLEIEVGPRRMI